MPLLNYIIPKLLTAKEDYYKNVPENMGFDDSLKIYQSIHTNEYNNISREESFLRSNMYTFFNCHINSLDCITIFDCIRYYDTRFMCKKQFGNIILCLGKYMKVINGFRRFVNLFRLKKYPTCNSETMDLSPLNKRHKHTIPIIHEKSVYYFNIIELVRIINSKLCNSEDFFSLSLPILNPYTNIPFSKTILYNIYFFIKHHTHINCVLFEAFFRNNFDLHHFQTNNSQTIMEYHINSLTKNNPNNELIRGIKTMIKHVNKFLKSTKKHKLVIEANFPQDLTIKALKPYYNLFLKFRYSNNSQKRFNYKQLFFYKMEKFILFNPKFGRTRVSLNKKESENGVRKYTSKSTTVNPEYLPFHSNENVISTSDFFKTHICEVRPEEYFWNSHIFYPSVYEQQDNLIMDDCDSDSDSDSDSNTNTNNEVRTNEIDANDAGSRLSAAFQQLFTTAGLTGPFSQENRTLNENPPQISGTIYPYSTIDVSSNQITQTVTTQSTQSTQTEQSEQSEQPEQPEQSQTQPPTFITQESALLDPLDFLGR